jgi:mRNA interferase MazF
LVISQGDVFWVEIGTPSGSALGYRHPHVVIQNNAFNRSGISTTVVCSVTSNLALGAAPGNVTLKKGEAGLAKRSVVNISQIVTVDKTDLVKRIGALSGKRLTEVLAGVRLLTEPRDPGNAPAPAG